MQPSSRSLALLIGLGRVGLGAGFLAAPDLGLRLMGVDGGTARRMTFLARMAGARDVSIGAGTVVARDTPAAASWLLAGGFADAVDAAVFGLVTRQGPVRRSIAVATVVAAAGSAAVSTWAAVAARRG